MTDIAGERARLAAQGLEIITREQWIAVQDYTSARTVNRPAQWLFLHITVTNDPADTTQAEAAACRVVEEIGQQRFGIGWSYNAGVMQSGRLYEGQPLTRRGAHTVNDKPNPNFPTGSLNYDARACALVQNVQDAVTDAQIDSAARWGAALRRSGEAIANARWYGHRDVTAKSCPGDKAYARLGELNALTDYYTQHGLVPTRSSGKVHDITSHPDPDLHRLDMASVDPDGRVRHTWGFSFDELLANPGQIIPNCLARGVSIAYLGRDLIITMVGFEGDTEGDGIGMWTVSWPDGAHEWHGPVRGPAVKVIDPAKV